MSTSGVTCELNAIGDCAHDYTALPGETIKFQLFLQNNGQEECEYGVDVRPPVALPADAVGEPTYEYFNGSSGTVDDCLVLPCGACVWVCWEVPLPEDAFCTAATMCVHLTKKTDETETIVKKNLKTGTAQVEIPVKPEVKELVSQTIAVGIEPDDLKSCPDSNGRRSNDGFGIEQWISGAWSDCDAAAMADACDSGFSFLDFIKACVAGEPLTAALGVIDKTVVGEAIQGLDLNGDGIVGGIIEGPEGPGFTPLEDFNAAQLKEAAEAVGVAKSGNKSELVQRILDAVLAGDE